MLPLRSDTSISNSKPAAAAAAPASAPKAELARRHLWFAPLLFFLAVSIPCALFLRASSTLGMPCFPLPAEHHRRDDQDQILMQFQNKHKPSVGPPAAAAPPKSVFENDTEPSSISGPAAWSTDELLENEDVRLERVLQAAAMENKTVILSTTNAAWAAPGSIMDLFLDSFRIGNGTSHLLEHLVIVALDPQAYSRCNSLHPHCFALVADDGVDFSGEKFYMTQGYLQLVWRKLDILRKVLAKGYNFVFSDVDVLWFRNPFLHFYPDVDFQMSCDVFQGDPASLNNWPNTGFMYAKANNRTIMFYEFWYASRLRFPGLAQQGVFRAIKFDPYVKQIGITFRFWSLDYFGGLCHPSKNLSRIVTMHANCCVGLGTKIHDLKVLLEDWRKYASLFSSSTSSRKMQVLQYSWSLLQLKCDSVL